MPCRRVLSAALATAVLIAAAPAYGQRARGIDVSYWQSVNPDPTVSDIDWSQVANSGVGFAFIRASRGGTIGGMTSPGGAQGSAGTGSHRYDDPYFEDNMAKAKANGILAGPYHFTRPDLIDNTDPDFPDYTGNTGLDEAKHYLQKARTYMRPGYLRPVIDVEAGGAETTRAQLTDWLLEFSNHIVAETGVKPIIYINSSYANDQVDARLNTHDLWLARYIDPTVVNTQTVDPPPANGYPNVYGVWNPSYPTMPAVKPWDFWQYNTTGRVPGISGNVDLNVANGKLEFVKDFLVPALWTNNTGGSWSNAANWNSVTYLPSVNDRVIINRTPANPFVSFDNNLSANIRSLQLNEEMAIASGSLTIAQYANLASPLSVNAGTLSAGNIHNTSTLRQNGGRIATGAITGSGTLTLNVGLLTATSIRQNAMTLSGGRVELTGSGTSVVSLLTIEAGAGTLDIGNTKFIVNYGATNPLASIQAALAARRIHVNSAADARMGVAYFLGPDLFNSFPATFGSATIDVTSVLLTGALRGDTDLSGTVNFADLVTLAQSYNAAGRWRQGDFTYDGVVNFADLVALAQNYNATESSAAAAFVASSSLAADWALARSLAQSLVPEPGVALAAISSLALLARRR